MTRRGEIHTIPVGRRDVRVPSLVRKKATKRRNDDDHEHDQGGNVARTTGCDDDGVVPEH